MTVDGLVVSIAGVTDVTSCELREAFNQACVSVEVTCISHSLSIGDTVDVTMGTVANNSVVMTGGIVKKIIGRYPQNDYVITIQDKLTRAVDFFIASDNPQAPYYAHNIKAEDLVVYLLGLAGITGVSASSTIFTYGTVAPGVPINLISPWSMIDTISKVCGFITYCDAGGTVHFMERKPYITVSDTVSSHSYATGNSGEITAIEYDQNTEALRNKVVVYGGVSNQIHYVTSAVSPYLPAGFYVAMVVANPLIDSLTAATTTGDLNLELYDRLTRTISLEAKWAGTRLNDICDITEGFTGLDSSTKWLVNANTTTIDRNGAVQKLTLIR